MVLAGVSEPYMESPLRASKLAPMLGPAVEERSAPSTPVRQKRSYAIDSALQRKDDWRVERDRLDFCNREEVLTATDRQLRESMSAFRRDRAAMLADGLSSSAQIAATLRSCQLEKPGTPVSPRRRTSPRDEKAPQPPERPQDARIAMQVLRMRAHVAERERVVSERYVDKVRADKASVEEIAKDRASKQQVLLTSSLNLSARRQALERTRAQTDAAIQDARHKDCLRRRAQTANAASLQQRVLQQRERAAEARTRAWRLSISSGAEVCRWNEPLTAPAFAPALKQCRARSPRVASLHPVIGRSTPTKSLPDS
jgi:hypothetical protein